MSKRLSSRARRETGFLLEFLGKIWLLVFYVSVLLSCEDTILGLGAATLSLCGHRQGIIIRRLLQWSVEWVYRTSYLPNSMSTRR